MRERVEDLGRLLVLLKLALDHDIFKAENRPLRPKDVWEWFYHLDDERKEEVLHFWVYGIREIEEKLEEMQEIANGTDPLNQPD